MIITMANCLAHMLIGIVLYFPLIYCAQLSEFVMPWVRSSSTTHLLAGCFFYSDLFCVLSWPRLFFSCTVNAYISSDDDLLFCGLELWDYQGIGVAVFSFFWICHVLLMMMTVWQSHYPIHLLLVLHHECLRKTWQLRVGFLLYPLKCAFLCPVCLCLGDCFLGQCTPKSDFMNVLSGDCHVHLIPIKLSYILSNLIHTFLKMSSCKKKYMWSTSYATKHKN